MESFNDPVVERMQVITQEWERANDQRSIFLRCYLMMTCNMLSAIDRQEFEDPLWVNYLLHRFADYYFEALEAYESDPTAAPLVWQLAFNASRDLTANTLQKLLLGVNAHINYDLVLTLADILRNEWAGLTNSQRSLRYADYSRVNDIISRTIDAVQDQIIEPNMPLMDILDKILGPIDEMLISRLISHWREAVWENATRLLETAEPDERSLLIRQVENEALKVGNFIRLRKQGLR